MGGGAGTGAARDVGGIAGVMEELLREDARDGGVELGEGGAGTLADSGGEDDDDEGWLDVSPEQFEAMLAKMSAGGGQGGGVGGGVGGGSGRAAAGVGEDGRGGRGGSGMDEDGEMVQNLVKGMEGFVHKVSGYKGAKVPQTIRAGQPDGVPSGLGKAATDGGENAGEVGREGGAEQEEYGVDFDAERFLAVLTKTLGAKGGGAAAAAGGVEGEPLRDEHSADGSESESDDWDDADLFGELDEESGMGGLERGLGAGLARREGAIGDGNELDGLSMQDLMSMMDRELEKEVRGAALRWAGGVEERGDARRERRSIDAAGRR